MEGIVVVTEGTETFIMGTVAAVEELANNSDKSYFLMWSFMSFGSFCGKETTRDVGDGVEDTCVANRKRDLSKTTSQEIYILPMDLSRHLYPLCIELYPKKTHKVDRKDNL